MRSALFTQVNAQWQVRGLARAGSPAPCTLTINHMNCSTERAFTSSSDAFVSLSSYRDDGSIRVSDSHSAETVSVKGFATKQLRSAISGYVSGLKYHDNEAAHVIEFCKDIEKSCRDVIERLESEQSKSTAS